MRARWRPTQPCGPAPKVSGANRISRSTSTVSPRAYFASSSAVPANAPRHKPLCAGCAVFSRDFMSGSGRPPGGACQHRHLGGELRSQIPDQTQGTRSPPLGDGSDCRKLGSPSAPVAPPAAVRAAGVRRNREHSPLSRSSPWRPRRFRPSPVPGRTAGTGRAERSSGRRSCRPPRRVRRRPRPSPCRPIRRHRWRTGGC